MSGFTASNNSDIFEHENPNEYFIVGGAGEFENTTDQPLVSVIPQDVYERVTEAMQQKSSILTDTEFIKYFSTEDDNCNVLYLKGSAIFSNLDKQLLEVFATNIVAAFTHVIINKEIVDTQKEVILTLGEVTESRSKETVNHVKRVAEYSYILAKAAGMSIEEAQKLKLASPMHDIGKIGIPDAILKKPGKLTDEEFAIMRTHAQVGYEIIKSSHRPILEVAAIVAQQHHEQWDGSGYPQGLKGEEIHLAGRITAIADVFDALTHARIYKPAWPLEKALNLLRENSGSHFDPKLIELFFDNLDEILNIREIYSDKVKSQIS